MTWRKQGRHGERLNNTDEPTVSTGRYTLSMHTEGNKEWPEQDGDTAVPN